MAQSLLAPLPRMAPPLRMALLAGGHPRCSHLLGHPRRPPQTHHPAGIAQRQQVRPRHRAPRFNAIAPQFLPFLKLLS